MIEEARNLVKSKGVGIGVASRNGISKEVHEAESVLAVLGRWPLRAKSYDDVLAKVLKGIGPKLA